MRDLFSQRNNRKHIQQSPDIQQQLWNIDRHNRLQRLHFPQQLTDLQQRQRRNFAQPDKIFHDQQLPHLQQ